MLGVTVKVEGSSGGSSASTIVVEPELFVRLCLLPDTSDMRRTPLMNPRRPSFSFPLPSLSRLRSSVLVWDVEREMDRAPYDAWRGNCGGALVGTCIDFGRRGRRGDDGGDPSSVEADPGSCERSPSMAPRMRPFLVLVGESTGANALRCLKLRSCLSSRAVDPSGDPCVDSGVSEDRKNQLGVRDDGVCDCDAAARGVASLPGCSSASTASVGPGLVSLLRVPHLLTEPIRDKIEDLGLLLDSEGESSAGAEFGVVGWGGEGRGVESCALSRSSKTL